MEGIPVYLLLASSFLHDNLQQASAAARLSDPARSLYDLAAGRSDLFVQASGDGSRVVLFQKGVPVQFGTSEWDDPPYTRPYTNGWTGGLRSIAEARYVPNTQFLSIPFRSELIHSAAQVSELSDCKRGFV